MAILFFFKSMILRKMAHIIAAKLRIKYPQVEWLGMQKNGRGNDGSRGEVGLQQRQKESCSL
jgi:hypothetical protein